MNFISSAYAQDASGGSFGGAGLAQFLPLVLIFVVFYFLMIRPQQQQQKALKAAVAAVKRGDRVLTAGGIIATVQRVKEGSNEVEVDIAPNVRVTVLRDTISSVLGDRGKGESPSKQEMTTANDSRVARDSKKEN
jgi:preprotein translocase subunit YajC